MKKEDFLKLMNEHFDSLMKLKSEKSFYEFEKQFEELWLSTGRRMMEKTISEPGLNRRKKKLLPGLERLKSVKAIVTARPLTVTRSVRTSRS